MSKQMQIEAVESTVFRGRYHYRVVGLPDLFKLGPDHLRSMRTFSTKTSAIRAGLREFPGSVKSG